VSEVVWEFGSNLELECHPERGSVEVKYEARSPGVKGFPEFWNRGFCRGLRKGSSSQ